MTPASPPAASLPQALPSAVPGVRRSLVADASGRAVEVADLSAARLARLPQGGVFAPFVVDGDRIVLGPPLSRRIAELGLSPLAVLALVERVLVDLDVLHAAGGAHGALDPDGWGVDSAGTFRVRANLGAAQRAGTPHEADVAAVGEVLTRLAPLTTLQAAGFAKATHWLHGAGVGTPRLGFSNARAALQALRALAPRRDLAAEAAAELGAAGLRLPPRVGSFAVRPVAQGQTRAHQLARDQANAEARAWVVRELDRLRVARLQDAAARARQRAERDIERLAEMARQEHAALVAETAPVRVGILEPATSPEPVTGARPNLPPARDEVPVVRVATIRRSLTAPKPVLPPPVREDAVPAPPPAAPVEPVVAPVPAATLLAPLEAPAAPPEGSPPPDVRQGEEGGDPDDAVLAEAAVVAEARHDAEGEEAEAYMEEGEAAAGEPAGTAEDAPEAGVGLRAEREAAEAVEIGLAGVEEAAADEGPTGPGAEARPVDPPVADAGVADPWGSEPGPPAAPPAPDMDTPGAVDEPAEPPGDAGPAEVEGSPTSVALSAEVSADPSPAPGAPTRPQPVGHGLLAAVEGGLRHAAEEVEAVVGAGEAELVAVAEGVEAEAAEVLGAPPPSHERVVDQVEGVLAGGLVGGVEAVAVAATGGLGAVAALEAVVVGSAVGVAEQLAQEGVVVAGHAAAGAAHPSPRAPTAAPPPPGATLAAPATAAPEPTPAPPPAGLLDAPDPLAAALARRVEEAAALARREAEARAEAAERARLDAERKLLEAERAALVAERRALEAERSIPRVLSTPPRVEELPELDPDQPADFGDDDPQPTVPGGVPAAAAPARNLAGVSGSAPTPASPPRPPAPRAEPEAPPEPPFPDLVDADHRDVAASPRWSGAVGVTGDSRREREKGPGKWVEQGRSAEELQAQLPSNGPRPVDLTEGASGGGGAAVWIFVGLVVIIAAVGVAIFW